MDYLRYSFYNFYNYFVSFYKKKSKQKKPNLVMPYLVHEMIQVLFTPTTIIQNRKTITEYVVEVKEVHVLVADGIGYIFMLISCIHFVGG